MSVFKLSVEVEGLRMDLTDLRRSMLESFLLLDLDLDFSIDLDKFRDLGKSLI